MARLIKPTTNFTLISNSLINDKNLSLKAKGLYLYVASKPDKWQFSRDRISKECGEGRDSIVYSLIELEKAGYLLRRRQSTGRMDYILFNSIEEKNKYIEENNIEASVGISDEGETPKTSQKASVGKADSRKSRRISNKEIINKTISSKEEKKLKFLGLKNSISDKTLQSQTLKYIKMRQEMGKPISLTQFEALVEDFKKHTTQQNIDAISNSLRNGYTGIIYSQSNSNNSPPKNETKYPYQAFTGYDETVRKSKDEWKGQKTRAETVKEALKKKLYSQK